MKTPQQIKDASLERFPLSPMGPTNDLRFGYIEGATQMQKDLLNELKHLCTYNSTAIGKQAECYLKVMPTLIEILDKHDIGVFLRGIVYRTYTQAQKDLLDSASESHNEWWKEQPQPFSGNKKGYKKGTFDGWQACSLSKMKEIQEIKENHLKDEEAWLITTKSRDEQIKEKDAEIERLKANIKPPSSGAFEVQCVNKYQ